MLQADPPRRQSQRPLPTRGIPYSWQGATAYTCPFCSHVASTAEDSAAHLEAAHFAGLTHRVRSANGKRAVSAPARRKRRVAPAFTWY